MWSWRLFVYFLTFLFEGQPRIVTTRLTQTSSTTPWSPSWPPAGTTNTPGPSSTPWTGRLCRTTTTTSSSPWTWRQCPRGWKPTTTSTRDFSLLTWRECWRTAKPTMRQTQNTTIVQTYWTNSSKTSWKIMGLWRRFKGGGIQHLKRKFNILSFFLVFTFI